MGGWEDRGKARIGGKDGGRWEERNGKGGIKGGLIAGGLWTWGLVRDWVRLAAGRVEFTVVFFFSFLFLSSSSLFVCSIP